MSNRPRQWHYVISPLGKCAWVDNGEPAPTWVSEAYWYGTTTARSLTEARTLVEGLRQARAQRVRAIVEGSPYEALVREISIMQEALRAARGALDRGHVALFWASVNTLDEQANAVQNSAVHWFESAQKETEMNDTTHETLLTCMAVEGGPENCCGCFNGRQNGESLEFFCNECGRVVFNAVERRVKANA